MLLYGNSLYTLIKVKHIFGKFATFSETTYVYVADRYIMYFKNKSE